MNNFERFQRKLAHRNKANEHMNHEFIFNGYNSTMICGNGREIAAAVVNKQESDLVYVYTRCGDKLDIGSTWTTKKLHFMISSEITIIKDVDWHKYIAIPCNVEFEEGYWGYFKGPNKQTITVDKNAVWTSNQEPLLVLPDGLLDFRDKVVIKGRPWMVQEYDAITTEGVVYYTLQATTLSKDENNAAEYDPSANYIITAPIQTLSYTSTPVLVDEEYNISANTPITLATENAYFVVDNKEAIKIKSRNSSSITFVINYGYEAVTIQVKEQGEIVEYNYKVVN